MIRFATNLMPNSLMLLMSKVNSWGTSESGVASRSMPAATLCCSVAPATRLCSTTCHQISL